MVRISMDGFVKKFQPEKYDLWKIGKDLAPHPEDDQSKLYSNHGPNKGRSKPARNTAEVLAIEES